MRQTARSSVAGSGGGSGVGDLVLGTSTSDATAHILDSTARPIYNGSVLSPLNLSTTQVVFIIPSASTVRVKAHAVLTDYTSISWGTAEDRIFSKASAALWFDFSIGGINFSDGVSSANRTVLNTGGNWGYGGNFTINARIHIRGAASTSAILIEDSSGALILTTGTSGELQIKSFTGAQATALGTPTKYTIIAVSSTDGVFTSTGLWFYNLADGAWQKLN